MSALPALHYPVTRSYPWPFFTPLVAVSTILALAVLIPLNIALTGYQVISGTNKNFDFAPYHWFNHFSGAPKPGSVCKAYPLYTGDTVYTDYGLFKYTIISPDINKPSAQSVAYEGINLDSCDVFTMGIDANAMSKSVVLSANVLCTDPGFPVLMRTTWMPWGIESDVGKQELAQLASGKYPETLEGTAAVSRLLVDASYDLFYALIASAATAPNTYAFSTWFGGCPAGTENVDCASNVTTGFNDFVHNVSPMTPGDYLKVTNGVPALDNEAYTPPEEATNNVLQILNAAVRLDLGRVFPNNVLTNTGLFDTTIKTVPNANAAYGYWLGPDFTNPDQNVVIPVPSKPNAVIDVNFDCTYYYAKSWGETLLAVIVATFTMFNTGWGVAMLVARYFARRKAGPDEHHALESPKRPHASPAKKSTSYVARGLAYMEKLEGDGDSQ